MEYHNPLCVVSETLSGENILPEKKNKIIFIRFNILIKQEITCIEAAISAPNPPVKGASWETIARPVFFTD